MVCWRKCLPLEYYILRYPVGRLEYSARRPSMPSYLDISNWRSYAAKRTNVHHVFIRAADLCRLYYVRAISRLPATASTSCHLFQCRLSRDPLDHPRQGSFLGKHTHPYHTPTPTRATHTRTLTHTPTHTNIGCPLDAIRTSACTPSRSLHSRPVPYPVRLPASICPVVSRPLGPSHPPPRTLQPERPPE